MVRNLALSLIMMFCWFLFTVVQQYWYLLCPLTFQCVKALWPLITIRLLLTQAVVSIIQFGREDTAQGGRNPRPEGQGQVVPLKGTIVSLSFSPNPESIKGRPYWKSSKKWKNLIFFLNYYFVFSQHKKHKIMPRIPIFHRENYF